MKLFLYETSGGKNLIIEYIKNLEKSERSGLYDIIRRLKLEGMSFLKKQDTRQLKGKLWEIKYKQNRMMYVLIEGDKIYVVHICKKQKQKAEKFEIELALRRLKEII